MSSSRVSSSPPTTVPPTPRSEGEILQSANVKSFAFNELKTATRNFRPDSVLGEGGFGCVYRGAIKVDAAAGDGTPPPMEVAVKQLNRNGLQARYIQIYSTNYMCTLLFGGSVRQ